MYVYIYIYTYYISYIHIHIYIYIYSTPSLPPAEPPRADFDLVEPAGAARTTTRVVRIYVDFWWGGALIILYNITSYYSISYDIIRVVSMFLVYVFIACVMCIFVNLCYVMLMFTYCIVIKLLVCISIFQGDWAYFASLALALLSAFNY